MLTAIDTENRIWRVIVRPDETKVISETGELEVKSYPEQVTLVRGEYATEQGHFTLPEARDFARSMMDAVEASIADAPRFHDALRDAENRE